MAEKVKLAEDLTTEELWKSALDFAWGNLWRWFSVIEEELGLEKAEALFRKFCQRFGEEMCQQWLAYFGVEEMDVPMMSQAADIIHRVMDLEAPWTVLSPRVGWETIKNCPIRGSQPEKYHPLGNCKILCSTVTKYFYPKMAKDKATCTVEKCVPEGAKECVVKVEFKE